MCSNGERSPMLDWVTKENVNLEDRDGATLSGGDEPPVAGLGTLLRHLLRHLHSDAVAVLPSAEDDAVRSTTGSAASASFMDKE